MFQGEGPVGWRRLGTLGNCTCPDPSEMRAWDSPGGPVVMNPPSNAGDTGSIPGWGAKIPTCRGATKPVRRSKDPAQRK